MLFIRYKCTAVFIIYTFSTSRISPSIHYRLFITPFIGAFVLCLSDFLFASRSLPIPFSPLSHPSLSSLTLHSQLLFLTSSLHSYSYLPFLNLFLLLSTSHNPHFHFLNYYLSSNFSLLSLSNFLPSPHFFFPFTFLQTFLAPIYPYFLSLSLSNFPLFSSSCLLTFSKPFFVLSSLLFHPFPSIPPLICLSSFPFIALPLSPLIKISVTPLFYSSLSLSVLLLFLLPRTIYFRPLSNFPLSPLPQASLLCHLLSPLFPFPYPRLPLIFACFPSRHMPSSSLTLDKPPEYRLI